ncbi:MAG: flagellin, partial [Defluviitaleaceae bacterium]|nr:flagellin [Defluviitaleaceae bacterium]
MSNMVVRTNIMALNSHRNLGMVGVQQSRASSRLSSGFRINSAADDAAGLGISEKMRAQIRGLDQASRNGQDGISLIQTAEGAMSTINEMVTRIRELVVQAANDTNAHDQLNSATWSQSDRTRIQDEINQLMAEIDATTKRVEFNTRTLLDGSLAAGTTGGVAGTVFEGFTTGHINFTGLAYPIEPGDVDLEDLVDALNDAIADDEVAFRAILQ